jgi:phosphohistidine phosphatase
MTEMFAQAGAIPYRMVDDGLEVLLISTSSGKHLTIPKGLIDPGFSATETALNEAYEEAGIEGDLVMPRIGRYRFKKWGGVCEVSVYAMSVTRQMNPWPESSTRRRLWVEYRQAARRVKHAALGDLILTLPKRLFGQKDRFRMGAD